MLVAGLPASRQATRRVRSAHLVVNEAPWHSHFAIEDKGILPDRMIAALAADGGILPVDRLRARPDPAGEPRPAARRSRLSRARELPARPHHGRRAHRRAEAARNSRSATAPCWRPAASISCRCWKAWRCPTIFPPPPIRKARPAGSTCSPASSPTRLRGFDRIEAGYHGPLYAEISPRTFPVLVREGSRLSQIRFRRGHALLDADALARAACARAAGRCRRRRCQRRRRGRRRSVRALGAGAASSAIAPSATPA